jgi:hypothetical protein
MQINSINQKNYKKILNEKYIKNSMSPENSVKNKNEKNESSDTLNSYRGVYIDVYVYIEICICAYFYIYIYVHVCIYVYIRIFLSPKKKVQIL